MAKKVAELKARLAELSRSTPDAQVDDGAPDSARKTIEGYVRSATNYLNSLIRQVHEAHGRGDRRWRGLMLTTLSTQ